MKFLVISKMKDVFFTLPPAVMRQIAEISMAGMEQQKKSGEVLDFYYSPAGYTVAILEEKNVEEWAKSQNSIPVLSYADFEVYPLTDGFSAMRNQIEKLKMTEKMMPGPPG